MTALAVGASTPVVTFHEGQPITTSRDVAAFFGKQHGHVLRQIRKLLESVGKEHESFFGLMHLHITIGGGAIRQDPTYRITRDGFTLLAMGFTGRRALDFKLAYIDAFNRMEAQLKAPTLPAPGTQPWAEDRLRQTFYRTRCLLSVSEFDNRPTLDPIADSACVVDPNDEAQMNGFLGSLPLHAVPAAMRTLTERVVGQIPRRLP